jgi:hypothetical protein
MRREPLSERLRARLDPDVAVSPVDGVRRKKTRERELNELAAAAFASDAGARFLKYLRAITINHVNGPGVAEKELLHLEGQRYLVAIIERRMDLGRQHEPKLDSERDSEPSDGPRPGCAGGSAEASPT